MPKHNVFCNVPWTNTHVYHDGSLGVCCAESHKIYNDTETQYNVKNMTLVEWYNQPPVTEIRKEMFGDKRLSICSTCFYREDLGFHNKRYKENYKTVIFTDKKHFDKSYEQSPGYNSFESSKENGRTELKPIDWHIDFGNECNLACKMCRPEESSKIGAQYRQWKLIPANSPIFNNWTDNENAWNNMIKSFDSVTNLNRFHVMGGEPLMSKRFIEFIDYIISTGRSKNLSLSFVTNGTLITQKLIDKFKKFKTCDIEVSIESFNKTNDYIRQGSSIEKLQENINLLLANRNDTFKLVMRSVPQLLNANTYNEYINWCYDNKVPVDSLVLKNPKYLQIQILPQNIKNTLIDRYTKLLSYFLNKKEETHKTIFAGRNDTKMEYIIEQEVVGMLTSLSAPEPENVELLRVELITWLKRWDKVYNLNALDYYPEYADFFKQYGY